MLAVHRVVGQERAGRAVRVPAIAQLAHELVDEVAAVGEDQDAAGAGRVDEAHGGHGLAGAGRVLEPEALGRVGILGSLLELVLVERHLGGVGRLLGLRLVLLVVVLVAELRLDGLEIVIDGEHRLGGGLRGAFHERLGEQRGERARQRVDLVRVQQRAVGEARLLLRQEPFEPEQERPGARPLRGRVREAVVELAQGGVERAAAVGAGCEDLCGVLPGQHEPFARKLLRALDLVGGGDGRGREGHWREISQGGVRNSDGRAEARAGKPGEQTPVWHCISTAEDLRKT